jgi:hypothetical protein
MPGFITHYLCAQAALKRLPSEVQAILNKYPSIYNIGAQGPDIFFYYLPGLIKKRVKGVGNLIHRENAGGFLLAMGDDIKEVYTKDEQEVVFAYASGFITHYTLDAAAHPYVYAKTDLKERNIMINRVEHRKFETAIDVLMLKLMSGSTPSAYKLWQLICGDAVQMRSAAGAVSQAIRSVHGREVQAREVYKAMRYMVQLTRILQSSKGKRKRLMELAENAMLGAPVVSSIIHMQQYDDKEDCLNINKTPWNKVTHKNNSFMELYQTAVDSGVTMIQGLYAYKTGELSRDALIKNIGNRCLYTGEIWEKHA